MTQFDIIVIGAGIAGASAAAHLAAERRVCILEMEERAGYHTTGRSAASYEPNYGPAAMLALTRASASFLHHPPPGFCDVALLTQRASLFLEADGQQGATDKFLASSVGLDEIDECEATSHFPVLRPGYARRCFLDRHTADLDVDLLLRGYLRLFKDRGGSLVTGASADRIERVDGSWLVQTPRGRFTAGVLVNAAGAWADVVAEQAGALQVGIVPKRRSIAIVPGPERIDFGGWPMVTDVGETWYAKPQSGKIMVSSADATPVVPHDAYADDMAIAEGIDRLMTATSLAVDRVDHSWGGLRSFAPDGNPVVGYDPTAADFFWLAGQGGYGIQSCPALSETAAAMVLDRDIPEAVLEQGLKLPDILPDRYCT